MDVQFLHEGFEVVRRDAQSQLAHERPEIFIGQTHGSAPGGGDESDEPPITPDVVIA